VTTANAVNAGRQMLRRTSRVRRRPDFLRAYDAGRRIQGQFMAIFVAPNGQGRSRLGVAATRKLGAAVERNRAKRLSREMFRRHKVDAGIDIIIVPRREMLDAPFTSLEAEYLSLLDRRDRARPRAGEPPRRRGRGARPASRL
jgi:ribonuclease P protein component